MQIRFAAEVLFVLLLFLPASCPSIFLNTLKQEPIPKARFYCTLTLNAKARPLVNFGRTFFMFFLSHVLLNIFIQQYNKAKKKRTMLQHNRSETFSEKFISRRCQSMLVFRLNTRSDINCLPNGFSIVSTYLRLPGFRLLPLAMIIVM